MSADVKSLLTTNMNPQAELMAKTRGLQSKWDQTGLLEGLNGVEKANMSILLENQAKQLLDEATATGTSSNSEQWAGVALPLVRRVFAEIAAKEFVSVQPMNLPSGLIFYLDFKYGTNNGAFSKDTSNNYSSLFGGTGTKLGSTDSATGGLYGAGRFGYSINDQSINHITATRAAVSSLSGVNFDANYSASVAAGEVFTLTTTNLYSASSAAGNVFDANGARSFTISAASIVTYFPSLTSINGSEVTFVVSGSNPASASLTVNYSVQPKDSNRGDFEDKTTTDSLSSIGIPEVNLELKRCCNSPNALQRQVQRGFQSTLQSEWSYARSQKFWRLSMAWFCRTLYAAHEGLAFHVRLNEFPCDQKVRGKDQRRANHVVVQMKT